MLRKPFFFEKKKQKTFAPLWACVPPSGGTLNKSKFFCFFLFTNRRAFFFHRQDLLCKPGLVQPKRPPDMKFAAGPSGAVACANFGRVMRHQGKYYV
jgi:hypothetical protein